LRKRNELTPLALAASALFHGGAFAQPAEPALGLKPTPQLREQIPQQVRPELPTFVRGERVTGRTDFETIVEGNGELRKGDTIIRADRLEYYQPDDLAKARGNVRINRAGNVYEGPQLEIKVDAFEGFFNQPRYHFLKNGAHGQADRVDFIDPNRAVVRNATYTTCRPDDLVPGWVPDWVMRAGSIRLDQTEDVGVATDAVLTFKGIPILPVPSISFPLSEQRKSGFLPPSIAVDNLNGVDYRQPYYWNIAPNRDATFYPRLMSKRGFDVGAEFRYLEANYRGTAQVNWMPDDKLRGGTSRWGYSVQHSGYALISPTYGTAHLTVNANRVSDDNYWRDFSRSIGSLTQRLLASDGILSWTSPDTRWFAMGRTLKWQTLQDVSAPITPPYDRMPELLVRYTRQDLAGGLVGSVEADTTRFESNRQLTLQPNAHRAYTLARLERPWQAPGWFVNPRVQLHSTYYNFDAPLAATGTQTASRTMPILSMDSGLVFERPVNVFGRAYAQTLEPRAFYVYTPFRNQNSLPNYDSALADFNFANVFTENEFVGHDRISANSMLTVGATTRFIRPETGAEAARFGIAQRLRFKDQPITLPGATPSNERLSDLLLGATLNLSPRWSFDGTLQYNPKTGTSERATIGGRYNPSNYRVVSAAYRAQRNLSRQIDVGWQWPLNDLWGDKGQDLGPGRGQGPNRWYSVGRLNYSFFDRRLVDTMIGIEYDACCWVGRLVFERLQSTTTSATARILFQLEFVGFSRLGSSVITPLRQNIPRYQLLHDPNLPPPSRFTNYD
jgi:LPS-assembly protein